MLPRVRQVRNAVAGAVLCSLWFGRLALGAGEPGAAGHWRTFQKTIQPFFAKHCFECHGDKQSGEIRLDEFRDATALTKGLPTIEKALGMLKKHAMPPKKRPRPSAEELAPVLSWLEDYVARLDRDLSAEPGRVLIRRLKRAEYNNTARDLLGGTFRPGADFPA